MTHFEGRWSPGLSGDRIMDIESMGDFIWALGIVLPEEVGMGISQKRRSFLKEMNIQGPVYGQQV